MFPDSEPPCPSRLCSLTVPLSVPLLGFSSPALGISVLARLAIKANFQLPGPNGSTSRAPMPIVGTAIFITRPGTLGWGTREEPQLMPSACPLHWAVNKAGWSPALRASSVLDLLASAG